MKKIDSYLNSALKDTVSASQHSLQKNKTSEAEVQTILTHYNPDYIVKNCRGLTQAEITNLCLFSPSPTLSDLNATYGKNVPIAWIMAQLFSLSEFCGAKEKMSEDKAEQTAFIIASSHYYLKVTELILFFHQMKAGHYGQFYGCIDPQVIIRAINTFIMQDRNPAIDREESRLRLIQREEERKNAVTYEKFLQLKKDNKL
jgi:hypothetical protein